MNINYCSNCGNKVEKSLNINFCSKCGQSLKTLKKTELVSNAYQPEDDIIDDNEVIEPRIVKDLSQLKKNIKISVDPDIPKPLTVGEYILQAKSSGPINADDYKRGQSNLPEGKDLLKFVAEECSSSRDKSSEVS